MFRFINVMIRENYGCFIRSDFETVRLNRIILVKSRCFLSRESQISVISFIFSVVSLHLIETQKQNGKQTSYTH